MPKVADSQKIENKLRTRFEAMNSAAKHAFLENVNEATGVSETTIYRWIRGTSKPRLAEQIAIAKILGLSVKTLFR